MNFHKEKYPNALEETNSLTEEIQSIQERFEKDVQTLSNVLELSRTRLQSTSEELQSIQQALERRKNVIREELRSIENHTQNLCEVQTGTASNSKSDKNCSQKEYNDYLDSLTNHIFNEKRDIWLCPSLLTKADRIPRFIPVKERSHNPKRPGTRFISLINFKGGVGKTTLTANLAAAFSTGNYRINGNATEARPLKVLVVDLDFQGTLSERCAIHKQLLDAIEQNKISSDLLTNPKSSQYTIDELTLQFEANENAFVIPSFDSLDFADSEQFVRFATHRRDVRYRFRQWFYTTKIFDSYDLVLFDCPPRKTVSSICALMASDWVFVPTAPESLDELAINRSIHWLVSFKMKLDAPYIIGGFILNRTQEKNKLSSSEINFQERTLYTLKNITLRTAEAERYVTQYGSPYFLKTFIPKRTGSKSINGQRGEPIPGSLQFQYEFPFFTDLASEMYERIYK